MTATATVVLSIIGTGIGVIGVLAAMLRILSTNVNRELQASTNRIDELKADPGRTHRRHQQAYRRHQQAH